VCTPAQKPLLALALPPTHQRPHHHTLISTETPPNRSGRLLACAVLNCSSRNPLSSF
jgi:hypothetical protein